MTPYDFTDLFVLDMANNHQGDEAHALRIIEECGQVVRKLGLKAALKFQFRNIETFIHPDFIDRSDVPHIPRFRDTRLTDETYLRLSQAVQEAGLITMCTPFDEVSVDKITAMDLEIIKIASCSATDFPLLEKACSAKKPIIASTAGLSLSQIDRLVSFFEHHGADFALMHCVAIYPTPAEKLNLNQIDELRTRYPNCVIGFSTHEDPENLQAVGMAVAKGAQMFERHVGLNTEKYSLNAYSSDPQQLEEWMRSFRTAKEICGGNERAPASAKETNSLRSLMRGVYAKTEIKEGQTIHDDDVFFAMPLQEGQLVSGEYHAGLKATKTYRTGELIVEPSESHQPTESEIIEGIVLQTKGLMREARIPLRSATSIDISHHYGLERFREFGCVVVDCINRTYCKKLIVLLPRQKHPYHYHLRKEETFQLLHGDVEVCVDGHQRKLELGETLLVEPEAWHKFHTLDGCIFEEISTTHFNDDSFYDDPQIAKLPREKRKTVVDQDLWMK